MAKDYKKILRESAQPHVSEPVVAAAGISPRGSLGALGFGKISGAAAMARISSANDAAGGLVKTGMVRFKHGLLVVTPNRLVALEVKPKGYGVKVLGTIADWSRDDVQVTIEQQTATKAVTIDVPATGEHYEVEIFSRMDQGVSDAFAAAIADRTLSPPTD